MIRTISKTLPRTIPCSAGTIQPARLYTSTFHSTTTQGDTPSPRHLYSRLVQARSNPQQHELHMHNLFQQGLDSTHPDTKRFAALYVLKSALRLAIHNSLQPWSSHLVKQAIQVVDNLASPPKEDPAAMTLTAQRLEIQYDSGESLLRARDIYKAVHELTKHHRWPAKPQHEEVITPGDFLLAYARYQLIYNSDEAAMLPLLEEAVFEYNHSEAALELHPYLRPDTFKYFDLLNKLAVSGHVHAAKELADFYNHPSPKLFAQLPEHMRRLIFTPTKVNIRASELPPYSRRFPFIDGMFFSFKGLIYKLILRPLRQWYYGPYYHPDTDPEYWRDSRAREFLRPWMKKNSDIIEYPLHSHLEDLVRLPYLTKPKYTATFKALDWYKFASLQGNIDATIAGIELAVQLKLPYEAMWWESERARVLEQIRASPRAATTQSRRLAASEYPLMLQSLWSVVASNPEWPNFVRYFPP